MRKAPDTTIRADDAENTADHRQCDKPTTARTAANKQFCSLITSVSANWHLIPFNGFSREHECDSVSLRLRRIVLLFKDALYKFTYLLYLHTDKHTDGRTTLR